MRFKINDNIKRTAQSITRYFSASLIPMVLSFVANPFIAMNMEPEDYAISGYFGSFGALISPLINFYFLQFYIKRYYEVKTEERQKLKAALYKVFLSYSVIMTVLCMFGILVYIKVFNPEIDIPIFPYLPLAILPSAFTTFYVLEQADYKMQKDSKKYTSFSLFKGIVQIALTVLLVVFMKTGAFGKLFGPFILDLGLFIYLIYKNRNLLKIKVDYQYIRQMFIFCWPLALAAMLGYFTNGFDKTYLETIGNTTEYGIYIVGASMAGYLHVFSSAISNTFQPDIYEAIATHNNRKMLKVFGVQLGMLSIVVIVFILLCPYLIYVLTAGRYMASTTYTRIISIATVTSALYFNINCFTIAKGYPKMSMWTSIIGSGLIIAAMWFAVKQWTYMGGAWMASFSYIIFFVVNILLLICVSNKKRMLNFIKSLRN